MAADHRCITRGERGASIAMLLLLVAVFGAQLLLAGAVHSLGRPLWFDEILTQTLVADGSLAHSLAAIADGVDFNPPTLHLLLRGYCTVWGETTAFGLRSFSLLCALLTLAAVFLTLRAAHRPLVALAATLGMATGEVLIHEAFQARFYSVWAALIAWFCFLLTRSDRSFLTRWHLVLRAVLAVLICTIHYFGIFSFALVVGAYCVGQRARPPQVRALLWSVLPGPMALVACTPFFLGQRAALTVSTWVPAANLSRVLGVISLLMPMLALSVCAIARYYSELSPMRRQRPERCARPSEELATGVPLASLILMPLVLVAFSVLVQPSMVARYAIVSCLSFAPVLAFLLGRCDRALTVFCLFVLALTPVGSMAKMSNQARAELRDQQALGDLIRAESRSDALVIEDALEALQMYTQEPELRERIRFLDFEVHELQQASAYAIVNRDVLRRYTRHYPGLQFAALDRLKSADRFLVLQSQREPLSWSDYGSFRVRPLGGRLYELTRPASP